MEESNIEEAGSCQIVSSLESSPNSVEPKLIEGTEEYDHNNLQSTNLEASLLQERTMNFILSDNKSNLQEVSDEPKVPIGHSVTLSPKADSSELPSTNEVPDGFPSSSSEACESKEDQDDSTTMKSNSANADFEVSKQKECPVRIVWTDEKSVLQEISAEQSDLQEISVKQEAPVSDSFTFSPKVDGFLSSPREAYESKEVQDGSVTMESSELNICAPSQPLLMLSKGTQDDASFTDSAKFTCETAPAFLEKVKEDKPLVVHRLHKRQMSLGDTRQKVPAPVSRSNTGKYLSRDNTMVDTMTHIESVKVAASKFGGSVNWKTRRTQQAQDSDRIILELDKLKNEISECKRQAEAAEVAKLSVFDELERTKKRINELEHVLKRQQAEEVNAKEDLELFQFILQDIEGVASDDRVLVEEKVKKIQERHKELVAKLMLVKDEAGKVQKEYDSLLIETDISTRKAETAFAMSKDAESQVEELTIELQRLKEILDLSQATCHDAEERKKDTFKARDEDYLTWEKDLRQADEEMNQIGKKLSSVQELQSKLDTSSSLLLDLKNELATCLEAKLTEEGQERETETNKSMQEAAILSRNELEEHRKSVAKATDELCSLKATAALLKSELNKEKAALAAAQRMEAMASITIQSLKVELKLSQQELEAVRAKAQECRDRTVELPKVLQDAAQEVEEAKSVATRAQEELRKAQEEVEQTKAALGTAEFRLQAVTRETYQSAKQSGRLAVFAPRALEGTKIAVSIGQQGSSEMITLDLDEYASLIERSHRAEELVRERAAAALAQVDAARESESRALSRLDATREALEERKRAWLAATEQADGATAGKLATERELRRWREEHGGKRRHRAGSEAPKPPGAAPPKKTAEIVAERGAAGSTACAGKDDGCGAGAGASVHPLWDASGRSSPGDQLALQLQPKTKKARKPSSFFPRVIMFLGRRRLRAAKSQQDGRARLRFLWCGGDALTRGV